MTKVITRVIVDGTELSWPIRGVTFEFMPQQAKAASIEVGFDRCTVEGDTLTIHTQPAEPQEGNG